MATKNKQIKVTLKRSTIRKHATHKACISGLGLRRIGQTVTVVDSPEIRGMINRVSYLLVVEET